MRIDVSKDLPRLVALASGFTEGKDMAWGTSKLPGSFVASAVCLRKTFSRRLAAQIVNCRLLLLLLTLSAILIRISDVN